MKEYYGRVIMIVNMSRISQHVNQAYYLERLYEKYRG